MIPKDTQPSKAGVILLGCIFICCYVMGFAFPDWWWGTHFVAFLPGPWDIVLLAIIGILLTISWITPDHPWLQKIAAISFPRLLERWLPVLVAVLMMLFMANFPIIFDIYGDAYRFGPHLKEVSQHSWTEFFQVILSFDPSLWGGRQMILECVAFFSWLFQVTNENAFDIMNIVCGGLFTGVWIYFILDTVKNRVWQVILTLAGLTAPFMLNFFGHFEVYAPVLLLELLFLVGLVLFNKRPDTKKVLGLLILLLVNVKLHKFGILLAPAWLIIATGYFFKRFSHRIHTWKFVGFGVLAPSLAAGLIVYFFVLGDHRDDRSLLTEALSLDHLFLPLFSPDPPLNRYNLFSPNHFFDLFNLLFFWSPVAILVLLYVLIFHRRSIDKNDRNLVLLGMTMALFMVAFFAINPLLSMPMDWDLFSLPAPALLVITTILVSKTENAPVPMPLIGVALSLALFCLPAFAIHTSPASLSYRLESLCIWNFRSYYEWTARNTGYALNLAGEDEATYTQRKSRILKKLKPYALPKVDREYANLLAEEGRHLLRTKKQPEAALAFLDTAYYYYPDLNVNIAYLMEAHFRLKQFRTAFQYSQKMLALEYPDIRQAYMAVMHCALEAGMYAEALEYSSEYLAQWPEDEKIREINFRLLTGKDLDALKYKFKLRE